MKQFYIAFFLFSLTLVAPAHAQLNANQVVMQRMQRMERELQLLQRQIARDERPARFRAPATPVSSDEVDEVGGEAKLGVRLSKMDEEMRDLRGQVEKIEFQNRKLEEQFEKFKRDTEFRFNEASRTTPASTTKATNGRKPINGGMEISVKPEVKTEETQNFANPRDHYNYAFRLLNQTKYAEASRAFDDFAKRYPKDQLIGNAYYWEGETYYIRGDYISAADSFRQGFEALPNGPKSADNLLKLAMSLAALKRESEACVVLGQVVSKYKKSSTSIAEKAAQEQTRIGC